MKHIVLCLASRYYSKASDGLICDYVSEGKLENNIDQAMETFEYEGPDLDMYI